MLLLIFPEALGIPQEVVCAVEHSIGKMLMVSKFNNQPNKEGSRVRGLQESMGASFSCLYRQISDLTRYEKPWITDSPYKKRERWDKVILWGCITMGFLLGCILCYFAYKNVPRHKYCLIMDDDFSNLDNWEHEIQIGGFGLVTFAFSNSASL